MADRRLTGYGLAGVAAVVLIAAVAHTTAAAIDWGPPEAEQQPILADLHGLSARQVRSAAFTLTSPQTLHIDAIGEPAKNDHSGLTRMLKAEREPDQRESWTGNAWILDLRSRRVVWEIGAASTTRARRDTRAFSGTVALPAGSYAAYLAAYPEGAFSSDEDGVLNKVWKYLGSDDIVDYKMVVSGTGQKMSDADVERVRQANAAQAIVAFRAQGHSQLQQAGFVLDRPTAIDLYAVGEAREDGEFDYGWIIDADSRAKIWRFTWKDSSPAGGAAKNRVARLRRTLPAGRYAAFFATDDSHDPSEWNAAPPADPDSWGLSIRVADPAARAAVRAMTYENVPERATIVALTRVGDTETRRQGFTLSRAMDVRIYAIGEGRGGRMFDYGWISSADTRRRVWEMRYDLTEHAGGDPKNRVVDTTIRLEKGAYIVHWTSDSSHSSVDWNAAAPTDERHWGITVLAAGGTVDRAAVGPLAENPDPSILADLTGVRDDDQMRKRFTLDRPAAVRIRAVGEGSRGGMDDFGWIEDASGRKVWEMTYRQTEHAGGAAKNRRVDTTITLPAGDYVVRFETDDSHAFGDWNADPPDEPEAWGILVSRVRQ